MTRFSDGNPRIVDGNDPPDGVMTVDIGAYEYQPLEEKPLQPS